MAGMGARDRLIVALDVSTPEEARALIAKLGDAVGFYKIGLELAMAGGLDLARELVRSGKRVFLDMKLLDIENTVERATRNAAAIGATFLTVHALDLKTLRAAMAGKAGTSLGILGVTVLTNLDASDLREQGVAATAADLVARRAGLAREAGCEGVVASGHEAAACVRSSGPGWDRNAGHPTARRGRWRSGARRRPRAGDCCRRGLSGRRPADQVAQEIQLTRPRLRAVDRRRPGETDACDGRINTQRKEGADAQRIRDCPRQRH